MAPSIDGVTHTFAEHGLYDGLFLMRDEETGTFWDHLTGEAVYGPGGSSPDLCVKAEEAPRLRLGCLGDLLFLEE